MKEASEILAIVLKTMASIYKRPMMHGTSAGEVDTLLWHYHALWIEIMERDLEGYRSEVSRIHGRRHSCNRSFEGHYRLHTKRGGEASEAEVIEYVLQTWKKMDGKLGIDVPEI